MVDQSPGQTPDHVLPQKRSRTGCYTCRRRGKKCDESWSKDGFCQRCLTGQYTCTGRTAPTARKSASSTSVNHTRSHDATIPFSSTASASTTTYAPTDHLTSRSAEDANVTLFSPIDLAGATTNESQGNARNDPKLQEAPTVEWSSNTFFGDMDPLSAFLASCEETIADFSTPNGNRLDYTHFPQISRPEGSTLPASIAAHSHVTPDSENHIQWPSRRGVSLSEIYSLVFDSWLVGLPSADREVVRAQILAFQNSNAKISAAKYAVAAIYTYLLTSDSACVRNPRRRLVELAYRFAGVPQPADDFAEFRIVPVESGQQDIPAADKISDYNTNVLVPVGRDFETSSWIRDAMYEIRRAFPRDIDELAETLWGLVDLKVVEFLRSGALRAYKVLDLGDDVVKALLGLRPEICLSDYQTPKLFSIKLFALSDLCRCIVHRGRRTLFKLTSEPGASHPNPTTSHIWDSYIGLPDGLAMTLFQIVDLCADKVSSPTLDVTRKAGELEGKIRAWLSAPLAIVDPPSIVFRTTVVEIWRTAILIILYQSVYKVGILHPILRQSLSDLLALLDSLTQLPHSDLCGFTGLPAFLAASLSVSSVDRVRSMKHMIRCGPQRLWLDNICLIEMLWAEVDASGVVVDWHEKMMREGLSVGFF